MKSTLSPEAIPCTNDRATNGCFATGNRGGPGNPFARQTAALRAYLINHVTERDIQDILDILLLNAKGGHLPSIKFLFSYVLGKPKPVVEPDSLDLQEMQMLQQSAVPPEALEGLCDQLPLDLQVQLARHAQTENMAVAVETARDHAPAAVTPPPTPQPSTPSTDGDFGASALASDEKPPSPNGENRRPSRPPKLAGFNWLEELRRPFGGLAAT
jgi:hypothetical protein